MSHTRTVELPCPKQVGDDGNECSGEVTCELEWNPGEMYGQDADGNRGIWQPGYWSPVSCSSKCSEGCELSDAEQELLADRAANEENESSDNEPYYDEADFYDPMDD